MAGRSAPTSSVATGAKSWHGCLKTVQGPILASLGGHVRHKRDLLEQVLDARQCAHTVWKLRDLRRARPTASDHSGEGGRVAGSFVIRSRG